MEVEFPFKPFVCFSANSLFQVDEVVAGAVSEEEAEDVVEELDPIRYLRLYSTKC